MPASSAGSGEARALPSWFPQTSSTPSLVTTDLVVSSDPSTEVNAPPLGHLFLAPPRGPDEIGWLGTYRVVKMLGAGGMGIVFEAEDVQLGRRVALKVMSPETARDLGARKRFLREARMTASLRSDNVVTVHQVGEINDVPFLAMELLPGETLANWLRHGPRPTPAQVLDVGLQAARGLETAHAAGLIHRDVKPSNLWIESPSGRVKLLDFGLARQSQDASPLTQVGTVVGTPAYSSPEQAEGGVVDGRSDLFSLGCVLYEMATGEPPFPGATTFAILTAIAVREPPSLRGVNPAFPVALSSAIMRLLAKKPADRPASAGTFAAELMAVAYAHPALRPTWLSGSRPGPASVVAKRVVSRRKFWAAGLAGALGLAGIGGGAYLLVQSNKGASSRSRVAAQGVSDEKVLFGMSGPLSGPTKELGSGMRAGIQAYFRHVNQQGGVAGRKLELVALDDAFDPERALSNVRQLDEEARVFGYVGAVGEVSAARALTHVLPRAMLFFGAFTGGRVLRNDPPDRYVFNYRASLEQETIAVVNYLLRKRKIRPNEIAVFSQDDASGFRGVEKALGAVGRDHDQILHVRYSRSMPKVEPAVAQVLANQEIKAVVTVATHGPGAQFIRQVRDARPKTLFTSTAFAGPMLAEGLKEAGPQYVEGVIVTQTVPHVDSHGSLVLNYRKHLSQYESGETPNSVSLEGYVVAAVLAEGLRRTGVELTTENLIAALESIGGLDLGLGAPVNFGPSDHQAIDKVWGAVLGRDGKPQPIDLD